MNEDHCTKCGDFWITNCVADENTCYSSYNAITGGVGVAGENPTCPYDLCREGMIDYFLSNLE